jgi:hypothetical protein
MTQLRVNTNKKWSFSQSLSQSDSNSVSQPDSHSVSRTVIQSVSHVMLCQLAYMPAGRAFLFLCSVGSLVTKCPVYDAFNKPLATVMTMTHTVSYEHDIFVSWNFPHN